MEVQQLDFVLIFSSGLIQGLDLSCFKSTVNNKNIQKKQKKCAQHFSKKAREKLTLLTTSLLKQLVFH